MLVPGVKITTTITLTDANSNFARVWVTDAPDGSEFKSELNKPGVTRFLVHEGICGENDRWVREFDKGGQYVLSIQEYTKGSGHGGRYQGDPEGSDTLTKTDLSTPKISVTQRLAHQVGYGSDKAELIVYVDDDGVQTTTVEAHGEDSPVIRADSPTTAIKTVLRDATTIAAVDALAGDTGSDLLSGLAASITSQIVDFNNHLSYDPGGGGIHASDDADNAVANSFKSPGSPKSIIAAVNELAKRIRQHMQNDDGEGIGSAALSYHSTIDWDNRMVGDSAGSLADAIALFGDCRRAYEAHRVSTTAHSSADNANTTAITSSLLPVHVAVSDVLRDDSPTVPAVANSDAIQLIHGAGFEEKDK